MILFKFQAFKKQGNPLGRKGISADSLDRRNFYE